MPSGEVVSTWGVDIKGFKGKGGQAEAWARETRARLAGIHGAMRSLARETRAVPGHDFTLAVHARGRNGQLALRWRLIGPARPARHLAGHCPPGRWPAARPGPVVSAGA
jgi:hypothetical protein